MTLVNPVSLLLQNLWLTWVYWVAFVAVVVFSGAWLGVFLAFVVASGVSFAWSKFVNKTLVPSQPHTTQHC